MVTRRILKSSRDIQGGWRKGKKKDRAMVPRLPLIFSFAFVLRVEFVDSPRPPPRGTDKSGVAYLRRNSVVEG